jgi:hypothetical protein
VPPPTSPADSDMQNAVTPFSSWIKEFERWKGHAKVYKTEQDFDAWVKQDETAEASALLTLSHHTQGKLCFDDELCPNVSVLAVDIKKRFKWPSVAIINACGTARPGASDFISALNRQGIAAIIATSTSVDATMAGKFLDILATMLRDNSAKTGYTLERAKFDAVRQLSSIKEKGQAYGPRALIYSFLGNGSLQVCVPPADSTQ